MPKSDPDTASPPRSRAPGAAAAILAAALLLALGAVWLIWMPQTRHAALIGGPFALEDGDGRTVTDESFRGKPFLVYFGYTHCPDVCPSELARISDVLAAMGEKAIPTLFVTVDPERDTPKVMQDYVSSFGPHVIGLSGGPQAVGQAERAFRVFARKGDVRPDGDYSMDHSSVVYLMDKSGRFVEALNLDRPPAEVAKELATYL
jgi:protein SCO1/2